MALAELAAYTKALTESSGIAQGMARAQTGDVSPLGELAGRAYAAPAPATATRQVWIATDAEPRRVESWTSSAPIPYGWHQITQPEAAAIQRSGHVSFTPGSSLPSVEPVSQVAALTYAAPSPDAVRDRRQPRAPRKPRLPRQPREPRATRESRPGRAARPPRPPRPARPDRKPRDLRLSRRPRPKNYKTRQKPGVCKGPGCTCWTPAGCAGDWYMAILGTAAFKDCYKGPCYSYEGCVEERCALHIDCLAQTILQFWVNTYHSVSVNPLQTAADAAHFVAAQVDRFATLARHPLQAAGFAGPDDSAGVTEGCPPGTRWAVGLTGYSCQSPATHPIAATREQLIAAGILTS